MAKKSLYILVVLFSFIIASLPYAQKAEAATTFKGTFVNVTYDETELKDGTVEKKLSKITLKNSAGKTTTLNIDDHTYLYINNTVTKIEGFKRGMKVEAKVNLRKVTELRGTSEVEEGEIVPKSKQKSGIVTKIDPNGMFIVVKLDQGNETTFTVNRNTDFRKGKDTVDLSTLYEGDRVHLKFSTATTSVLAEVEIVATGIIIENLYKAEFQTVNASANKMTVKNAQPFVNWLFGTRNSTSLSTFEFAKNAPIYAGNKKITKNELKNYRTSDVYFVTVEKFGKEIVQKIMVLENYERTYYEPMTAVNTTSKFIRLKDAGKINFHEGTILVRHGRLVEPSTLVAYGTAFVVTDGLTKTNFAQVINITNDSFMAPNLNTQNLYFGQLWDVDGYNLELRNLYNLKNHIWTEIKSTEFAFSNSTHAEENYGGSTLRVIPNMDLEWKIPDYGYFYVKDGHIQAIHFITSKEWVGEVVSTGRVQSVDTTTDNEKVTLKNVSRWMNKAWSEMGSMPNVSINKALIIRDGKVIEPKDIKANDRAVLITTNTINGHVLLLNEE
ncbi:hypothetical protein SAMN05880501_10383 [Ureibacillus xyleni]|uniref:Uncharacterized protein n=1 Tax=Ureibacillus xyleni TaxID=614648 RepID=A0A285SAP5_9BACL|nr:hypothetical protein [Ureibacillus xyleni]SOC02656.1 hypothetical protein SAMN05880501_10383 [Ureibacillus xyleni]